MIQNKPRPYNLKDRTFLFSTEVIRFIKQCPYNYINKTIFNQLIRSATSIGANVEEADESFSKADFTYKISIAKKESKETNYWLRLVQNIIIFSEKQKNELHMLINETKEFVKIINSMIRFR